MVLYLAIINSNVESENIASIQADPLSFNVLTKLKCTSCNEHFLKDEQHQIPGGKGLANLVGKCKFCSHSYSVSFSMDHFKNVKFSDLQKDPLFALECRGIEPLSCSIDTGMSGHVESSDNSVDISFGYEKDWCYFDEKSNSPVKSVSTALENHLSIYKLSKDPLATNRPLCSYGKIPDQHFRIRVHPKFFYFSYPWESVTLASFFKYPNPFSAHVLSADIISSQIDPVTGCLHIRRILHKTSTLPSWIRKFYNTTQAFVLEESIVDPKQSRMTITTRNLSHARVAVVEERIVIGRSEFDAVGSTIVDTNIKVVSYFGWGARNRIESYMSKRLKEHFSKSKNVFQFVLDRLRSQQPV